MMTDGKLKELLNHPDAWRNEEIYKEIYEFASRNPVEYWEAQIDRLSWIKKPTIMSRDLGNGIHEWFSDGKINACYNCVDRHALKNPKKTAIIWQSEDIDRYEYISYKKLQDEVSRFANTLKKLGLTRNDYVTVYMPMVPEGIYSCLACARLGIPYTVVFAGFSPNAVALRMNDCNSSFIISCDANVRGGKIIPLKNNIDEARKLCNDRPIKSLIVRRQNIEINWDRNLDYDYYDLAKDESTECEIVETNSTDDLFILYTSGSVGKPKGILQGTGGFLLFSSITQKYFFNMYDDSIFWCSGDIGWMGGHAYSLYAPLCNGVTSVIFEGIPTYPRPSIFFEVIDKHKITSFNTAPTALRAMMQHSKESLGSTSRDSLKNLGVFGEVLNKETWMWYFNEVGKKRCPIVNMWGQTELGGVPTAPLCNLDDMKTFGHIGRKFFGCNFVIKDEDDNDITTPEKVGALYIKDSMPGMLKGIYGDKEGLYRLYYSNSKNLYCTGDEAYFDNDGNVWITGRIDDVLNVSGHRISPIEIEEVIGKSEIVAEVSVVGCPHKIKGEGIHAFIVLKRDISDENKKNAKDIISNIVGEMISPITKPDIITIVKDLPKTRSGKIMRRILRKIASNDINNFDDMTTISNPECIDEIIDILKKA